MAGGLAFYLLLQGILTVQIAEARVWHVQASAIYNPNKINSETNPFPLIQMGADSAFAGDTVLVSAGTYYETVKVPHAGVDSTNGIIYYIYFVAKGDGPAIVKAKDNFCFLIGEAISIGNTIHRDFIWIEGFYITNGYGVTTPHGSGIRTFSDYGVFINNKIYDNDVGVFCEGNGTYAEAGNNRGNYIAHNVISNSGESAVRIKHSSENDVVFNLMYHNGYRLEPAFAVTFYCGVGNRIINNTMWDNGGGAVQAYNGTASDSCIASANSEVRDNIFSGPNATILMDIEEKTANDGTSVFAYNLFWGPDSAAQLVWWGANEYHEGGYKLTLSQFVNFADSINPENGLGTFFADPLFANPSALNFDLMPASPALDAGSRPVAESPFRGAPILADGRARAAGSRTVAESPFRVPPDTLRSSKDWPAPPDSIWADSLTGISTQALDIETVDLGYHHRPQLYSTNPDLWTESQSIPLFPNPYSGTGGLQFMLTNLPSPRRISGKVYNIRGQKVAEFRVPDDALNVFVIRWNALSLANGKYIVEFNVNGRIYREPILLLK